MAQKEFTEDKGTKQVVYLGIDVHKESWSLTFLVGGVVKQHCRIQADTLQLARLIEHYEGHRILSIYEAGFSGYWLHEELVKLGVENTIVSPHRIPIEAGNRVKTDRRDSKKLAVLLSQNQIEGIRIRSEKELVKRQHLRMRRQLMKERIAKINKIKMLSLSFGVSCTGPGLCHRTRANLLNDPRLSGLKQLLAIQLESLEMIEAHIVKVNQLAKEAHHEEADHQGITLLKSIPGIGPLTAMTILEEIPNITDFTPGQLAAFVGLTPSEYSSGPHIRRGRITGQGNPTLRALLVEAAWGAVRRDTYFCNKFDALYRQTASKKKAIVAIARRLLLLMRTILKRGTEYRPQLESAA